MTAYAPTWTGRIRVSYFVGQAAHTQTWRYPGPSSGSGVSDLLTVIADFYAALEPQMWSDWIINSVVVADIDSPVFLPIVNPFSVTGAQDLAADFVPEDKARCGTFIGRTTGGNPWKLGQYGLAPTAIEAGLGTNYRVLENENAAIGAAIAVLQAGAGTILGNDGNPPAVYDYMDWKPNDRWVKKVRRGA